MEAAFILIGAVLGAAIAIAPSLVLRRESRREATTLEKRVLYARSLAANDGAYRIVDFLVTWPRRVNQSAAPSPGEKPTVRAAAIINNASVELDDTIRRARETTAALRVLADDHLVPLALAMHEELEAAVLAVRIETAAQLDRRWAIIAPRWRSAREAFVDAARQSIADES